MLKKNDIKLIRSLRLKKYRQKYNKFIVEGEKIAIEAIKFQNKNIDHIYCVNEFIEKNEQILEDIQGELTIVSEKELNQISNLKTANSVVVVLNKQDINTNDIILGSNLIVFLDDIMDPGNMGTIIRSCDWFNIDSLVVSPNSVDIYNPKVIQSSMGSIFRLPIHRMDFEMLNSITKDQGIEYYGTLLNGENMNSIKYKTPLVMVIGNESKGISESVQQSIKNKITIPRYNKITESLNAAVATGIVLADIKGKIK